MGQVPGDLDCELGPSLRGKGSPSRARHRHSRDGAHVQRGPRGKGRCRGQRGGQSSGVQVTGVELERRGGKFKSKGGVRQRSL